MPLPFILAGLAIMAGGYGVKKGIDAKGDFDLAEQITNKARKAYDSAHKKLDLTRASVQLSLETLGKLKACVYSDELIPFIYAFQQIKNVDFHDADLDGDINLTISEAEMADIRDITLKMADVLGGGIAALGSGGLAGLAAFGGVGALGALASTGTVIGTLSGAALTNATLAWLGGGALGTGATAFGMAGGMAVLGGIVAGPVLAVGGVLLASKAEKAVEDARTNREKSKAAVEAMNTANVAALGIKRRSDEIFTVLNELKLTFKPLLQAIILLVGRDIDYRNYTAAEKGQVMRCAAVAKTAKNVAEVPVIDAEGTVTQESSRVVKEARAFLEKLAAV